MSRLCVVTAYYNPCGYSNRYDNYRCFADALSEQRVPLVTVEVAARKFVLPDAIHLVSDSVLWHKEAAINVGIRSVWSEYDAVAWVDADIIFADDGWVDTTLAALKKSPVVQPWYTAYRKNAGGGVHKQEHSLAVDMSATPGFAWAATSNYLKQLRGLYDATIIGGGDRVNAYAFYRDTRVMLPWACGEQYGINTWLRKTAHFSQVPAVPVAGDITHLYHGERTNRRYLQRHQELDALGYNAAKHIRRQENGLLGWTAEAPQKLVKHVAKYFWDRKEDG